MNGIECREGGVYIVRNGGIVPAGEDGRRQLAEACREHGTAEPESPAAAADRFRQETIAAGILRSHTEKTTGDGLSIRFDALASHDITYVGIIQTARASGLEHFPLPYVLTNCHNSLCAVGGTINEDDHLFGLSAAKKYGGIFVPAHLAVIHQYMRENMAGCGRMILGSDSHTRYGALGCMAVGEGGPELVKQLLGRTYDIPHPEVVAVYLEGSLRPGVGPQDVALALIGSVFPNGFVKNRILEFVGPGIGNLSVDTRNGIDVMTTETTCLSSIWETDAAVEAYLEAHGRAEDYRRLAPGPIAYYDRFIRVDLSAVEPMIALPFHPSNAFTIRDFSANAADILRNVEKQASSSLGVPEDAFSLGGKLENGRLRVDQAVVAGCAGGSYENIVAAADILRDGAIGTEGFGLSVYPASQAIGMQLAKQGISAELMAGGAVLRSAFCGPCFGAGDVPANGSLSIRHTTRNFPSREGSKPASGQTASVALMDARSIAATARNGGYLTAADELDVTYSKPDYRFDDRAYRSRVYRGFEAAATTGELRFGPNIADWPAMIPLPENLILKAASVITDPVTTTDELIPSGEISSYRSNPFKLAEYALSRRDPAYVGRAKASRRLEEIRQTFISSDDGTPLSEELRDILGTVAVNTGVNGSAEKELRSLAADTGIGSILFAMKPGDGSAREQAASSQKVLGGWANAAVEYATKRYRSNVINWGMIPFTVEREIVETVAVDDILFIPGIRQAVEEGHSEVAAVLYSTTGGRSSRREITLKLSELAEEERRIILAGCLINRYREQA